MTITVNVFYIMGIVALLTSTFPFVVAVQALKNRNYIGGLAMVGYFAFFILIGLHFFIEH